MEDNTFLIGFLIYIAGIIAFLVFLAKNDEVNGVFSILWPFILFFYVFLYLPFSFLKGVASFVTNGLPDGYGQTEFERNISHKNKKSFQKKMTPEEYMRKEKHLKEKRLKKAEIKKNAK